METTITAILSAKVDAFISGINQATSKLQNFGQKAEDIGGTLTQKITLPLGLLGGASLKAAADMDSLKKGLTAIMGSTQSAERELTKLKEVAKLPGLGFQEAVKGSINLQAAGFSADMARRALAGFGNALGTVGKGKAELDGVTLALTQMASSPKVLQEEINQIRERLPQFSQLMVDAFGTARSEDIQKLGISGKAFVARMVTELEKLPKAMGGLKNASENTFDSLSANAARFGEIINKNFNVEGMLNKFADALTNLTDKFVALSPSTQNFIISLAAIAAAAGPLALALGSIVRTLPVLQAGFSAMLGPIGLISTAVILLATNWDTVRDSAYEALYAIGKYTGQALVDLGNKVGSQTLVNEGKAQLAKSQSFRGTYLPQQSTAAVTGDPSAAEDIRDPAKAKRVAALIDPDAEKKLKVYVDAQSEASKNIIESLQRVRDTSISLISDETERKKEELKAQAADRRVQATTEVSDERQRAKEILSINEKLAADLKTLDQIKPLKSTAQGVSTFQAFKDAGFNTNSDKGDLQKDLLGKTAELPGMKALIKALETLAKQMKKPLSDMEQRLEGLADSISRSLQNAASAGLEGMGDIVGGLLSGTKDLASLPQLFAGVLGGLAKQIGQSMIKFGVAGIAIKKLAINPFLAIAAGVGLIALGSALSASVQKSTGSIKLAKGGLAYGPTLATVGDNTNARYDPEVISPLSKLREYMGGGTGNIEVNGRLSNDVIRLSNARGQQTRNTLRGK